MEKIKGYIQKINDNIDKAKDYRNTMALKCLAGIGVFIGCYFAHGLDIADWLFYIIQFLSVFYIAYTAIVAGFITYVDLVIASKVEAVSVGSGATKMVVEQVRDKAFEKVRSIKTEETNS